MRRLIIGHNNFAPNLGPLTPEKKRFVGKWRPRGTGSQKVAFAAWLDGKFPAHDISRKPMDGHSLRQAARLLAEGRALIAEQ